MNMQKVTLPMKECDTHTLPLKIPDHIYMPIMLNAEHQYLDILRELIEVAEHGVSTENRTATDTFKLPPQMLQHDMADGFPLLTTKRVAVKTMAVELEGFIKGITSKKWFQDRGCKIWNEWCNPQKVPYGQDEETLAKMAAEDDLGPCIYGASWRGFHDPEATVNHAWSGSHTDDIEHVGQRVDQFQKIVDTLKTNPTDRRMICMAWNPLGLDHTALPPCHMMFQVTTRGKKLDLTWNQRSADWKLGIPFNLASYGLLLQLFAKESGFVPGILTGFLGDVHLYENHVEQAQEQLSREVRPLPRLEFNKWDGIFNWTHEDTTVEDYHPHPPIKAPVAV